MSLCPCRDMIRGSYQKGKKYLKNVLTRPRFAMPFVAPPVATLMNGELFSKSAFPLLCKCGTAEHAQRAIRSRDTSTVTVDDRKLQGEKHVRR